ncbi:MAG TPA: hypothetical protein PKI11_11005 [Candidatus Hydrogenedentes bacterium]|nr:hypothetical protein [Candidatus Hydrogenedentota bacterium]HNT87079.1 hypothetical protein [Candidatus Hydrogenedentota bacterium]
MQCARREYVFPLVLGAVVVIIGSLPYVYGYLSAGPDEVFMGFVGRGTPGANGYFMLARQAAEGEVFMVNRMTPEPTPQAYFSLQWLLFGRLVRWTGLSMIAMFHIWRVASMVLFTCAVYYLLAACLDSVFLRRLALALIVFGSGLGWTVWIARKAAGMDLPYPHDLLGVSVFGYLVNNPHFVRAGIFAALTVAFLLRGEATGKLRYFVYSGLAATGHGIIRPYLVPEVYLLYALFPALLNVAEGRWQWRRFAPYAVAGLVFLPTAAYLALTAYANVLGMAGWRRQSLFFLEQALWLGIPFVIVVGYFLLTGFTKLRGARPATLLLGLWIGVVMLLIHTYPYFIAGQELCFWALTIAPPILLLLGPGPALLEWTRRLAPRVVDRLTAPPWRAWAALVLVLACGPSSGYVYARDFKDLHGPVPPWRYYLDKDVHAALEWLDAHTRPNEVALASHDTSQFIPRLSRNKVVTGHDMLTANYGEKNGLVHRFYAARGEDEYKRWLARRFNVRYVVFGPYEWVHNGAEPADHPWLVEVFRRGGVAVYHVEPDAKP